LPMADVEAPVPTPPGLPNGRGFHFWASVR